MVCMLYSLHRILRIGYGYDKEDGITPRKQTQGDISTYQQVNHSLAFWIDSRFESSTPDRNNQKWACRRSRKRLDEGLYPRKGGDPRSLDWREPTIFQLDTEDRFEHPRQLFQHDPVGVGVVLLADNRRV